MISFLPPFLHPSLPPFFLSLLFFLLPSSCSPLHSTSLAITTNISLKKETKSRNYHGIFGEEGNNLIYSFDVGKCVFENCIQGFFSSSGCLGILYHRPSDHKYQKSPWSNFSSSDMLAQKIILKSSLTMSTINKLKKTKGHRF